MEIRTLGFDDLDALLALYRHLNPDDQPLPARPVVEAAARQLLGEPAWRVYGGFEGGELVSSCTLVRVPNLTRGCASYGLIENVVTDAAHRGRGHGRALLAQALGDAWAAGCYKVMLLTGRKDEAVYRFYEGAGFDRHGKQAFIARPPAGTRG